MRIIAGEFRNRKLLPPIGDRTRPITDRVKQSVFDILTPWLENAVVYDLFAGTGSLGLECLSRGAKCATFFESDHSAVGLLKKNIAALGLDRRATIVPADLFRWFADGNLSGRADLVFLDPPYRFLSERAEDLKSLGAHLAAEHLSPDGWVVFRHDIADSLTMADLKLRDVRDYGSMRLEFLGGA